MVSKEKAKKIVAILSQNFSDKPALHYGTPYELLVAVMLSAQCTDERVNKVTAELYKDYDTPEKMLALSQEELEEKIFSCGLYKTKAAHILSASRDILTRFGGKVPDNLKDLQSLAGVGVKTANVVYSVAFGGDAIAVDTHVFRVSNRIGLADAANVTKTEKQLMDNIEKSMWRKAHHYLIYLGRQVCKAGRPLCGACPIEALCEKNIKNRK